MIFFQGTDDKLWRSNLDGTGGIWLGGYKTKSTPLVYGDFVYFQGTDDKLWRIKQQDGSSGINFGGHKTKSTPAVSAGRVYFQGTDNKLWRIDLDATNSTHVGGYDSKSSPAVSGGFVYFQGTDDKLWKVRIDGSNGVNLGLYKTKSYPCVSGGHVYFQGTDNKLWRINLDGTQGVHLGGYDTKSTPCVAGGFVFFQGTDDKLWRINLDGSHGTNLGGYKAKSSPYVDATDQFVFFQGTDNKLWRLKLDGSDGTHIGGFDTASTPFVVEPRNQPVVGTVQPRYMVLTLVYAPPGTNGGKSTSSVQYGSTSSTGVKTTISTASKNSFGVDLSLDFGIFSIGGSFSRTSTVTDSSSFEVKKSQSNTITLGGPAADGINHDEDVFYLWLNPDLAIAIDPEDNVNWNLGAAGPTMNIQAVFTGWLKNPASMPPGIQHQLSAAGLSNADYGAILAMNPFAGGAAAIDPNRFLPTSYTFPYGPPLTAADPVPTTSYVQQNTVTNQSSHTFEIKYEVGLKASVGAALSALFKDSGGKASVEWTNSSSTENTNATSQSATVTVGGPAFGYTGPTDVAVFWDTIFNSFVFAFAMDPPSASGRITDQSGKPFAHQLITLSTAGHTFTTLTGANGDYRFHRVSAGQGKLSVSGQHFTVAVGPGTQAAVLQLSGKIL